jgi:hypothetical protein
MAAFGVVRLVRGDEAFMNDISLKIHSMLDQIWGFFKYTAMALDKHAAAT